MSLFQKNILKKYSKSQNQDELKEKWALFKTYFHNSTIQENIRNSKEEQFQEGFLRELFVKVLGYTLNPEPNFNLTTEYKNVKDSKKADGAIIIASKVKAVIELKGTDTTDLGKVESQAFNYKNNQPECIYVITSNFEKIRFYIENAIEHIEFNLFNLTEEEFQLLYVCLSQKNIENNTPKHIKDESVSQEDVITKKLYHDYSLFKRELHQNLVKLNPNFEPLELFKKSQKLLDRFLFIFFAEDRSLLPTNLILRINKEWQQLREMRIEVSLYDRYKVYFNDLNHGAKVSLPAFSQTTTAKKEEYQIFAYNGGLFKDDEVLNDVKIDDDVLFKHTEKLSNYDFASEVDVNILGHIFENSLNDLDEIKAQLEGQEIEKTKTKRKKDGVFYTPKYITKYIVDNTVGKLCAEKKEELNLNDEDYITDKKRQQKTKQALAEKLNTYRSWLLQLTICDPACGSGAFLNQALDFLITEHRYIDELHAKLFGDALLLSDVEGSILENNLFGVDINEESIEIAQLSLWLRTAQPNRKLNDLNSNIKCGNSLIDDITVAGDKAFNWGNEFKQVFSKGGFDVVIGNPPYGASLNIIEKEYIRKKYISMEGEFDTYIYFIETSFKICKSKAQCGYIVPNNLLQQKFGRNIRQMLLENSSIEKIIDLGLGIFSDAVVPTSIIHYKLLKATDGNIVECLYRPKTNNLNDGLIKINQSDFYKNENFTFNIQLNNIDKKIILKLENNCQRLNEICELKIGIEAAPEYITDKPIDSYSKPMVRGRNFNRYTMNFENDPKYIHYERKLLHRPREERLFDCPKKILIRQTGDRIIASLDTNRLYAWKSVFVILCDEAIIQYEYLLAVLNSKLINFYYQKLVGESGRVFAQVKGVNLDKMPIIILPLFKQKVFVDLAKKMFTLNEELSEILGKFQRTINRKFNLEDSFKNIDNWYLFSYSDFIKELSKKKIKLSLSDEAEWELYFNAEARKALELKAEINATDKEIDQMVYKLYDLTEEERKIIEESTVK